MAQFTKHYNDFQDVRHIIIDDAQNMRADDYVEWYKKAEDIIKKNNRTSGGDLEIGFFWVFLDMSQKETKSPSGLPTLAQQAQQEIYVLDKVVRNPKRIFEESKYLQQFCNGSQCWESDDVEKFYHKRVFSRTQISHGYEGQVVKHVIMRDDNDDYAPVADKVKEIIDLHLEKSGKLGDIAVLVSNTPDAKLLQQRLQETTSYGAISAAGPISLESTSSFVGYPEVNECLIVDSVRRFAGLERPVIISACVSVKHYDMYSDSNRLKYLAVTRALSKVHIINMPEF